MLGGNSIDRFEPITGRLELPVAPVITGMGSGQTSPIYGQKKQQFWYLGRHRRDQESQLTLQSTIFTAKTGVTGQSDGETGLRRTGSRTIPHRRTLRKRLKIGDL